MHPSRSTRARGAILITGAASGIGRCAVGAWAARGERVVATDIDVALLEAAAASDRWPRTQVLTLPIATSWR